MNKFCMLDLETLSSSPRAMVLSIGALMFDLDVPLHVETLDDFMINHMFGDCFFMRFKQQPGREISPDTVAWWVRQGKAAIDKAFDLANRFDTRDALVNSFYDWYKRHSPEACFAYPATFDHVILQNLYDDYGLDNPISYSRQLDMRTIVKLLDIPKPNNLPEWLVPHDPVHDCVAQALWITEALTKLRQL